MSNKIRTIDLTEDISPKTKALGRGEGTELALKHNIPNTLIRAKTNIEIVFPETLYTVGTLAFIQLFELAYRKLGDVEFNKKINFVASDACLNSLKDNFKILLDQIMDENKDRATAYVDVEGEQ
jgi:hypothetical protein